MNISKLVSRAAGLCAFLWILALAGCDAAVVAAVANSGGGKEKGGTPGPPVTPSSGYRVTVTKTDSRTLDCKLARDATANETLLGCSFDLAFPSGVSLGSVASASAVGVLAGGSVAVGIDSVDRSRVKVACGKPENGVVGVGEMVTFRIVAAADLPASFVPTVQGAQVFRISSLGRFAEQASSTAQWSAGSP